MKLVVAAAVLAAGCGRLGFAELDESFATAPWVDLATSGTGGGVTEALEGTSVATARIAIGRSGHPVIAWSDDSDGDLDVRMRRWDGGAWIEVGGSMTAGGISNDPDTSRAGGLAVNGDDEPCISWFIEETNALRLRCWDGAAWVGLGGSDAIPTTGNPWWPTVELDPNPIVAFEDYGTGSGTVHVKRYDDTLGWTELTGTANGPGVGGPHTRGVSLEAMHGELWLAWERSDLEDIFVATWNGSDWVQRGNLSATAAKSERVSIVVGAASYAVWLDGPVDNAAVYLKEWTGTEWIELGGSATGLGVSGDRFPSRYPSIVIGPDAEPIVAYEHAGDVYVARWDGAAWISLGEQLANGGISSSGVANSPKLAIADDGTVYVAWLHRPPSGMQVYMKALHLP